LIIFLFNVGGYYLVFWGLRSQAKSELLHRLDADEYASEDIEILTIPISLPYPIHQNGYERAYGEFEHNGSYFNLVKQKIENDTLFIVCIKNHQEKKLVNELTQYANLMNNVPASTKHTIELFGKLFKDYTSIGSLCISCNEGWERNIYFSEITLVLQTKKYPVLSPPPKVS
jgi:hypothetical protein